MRNGEMPIDTNDFFRKKVEFKKEGDDLVVVEKPNNGEQTRHIDEYTKEIDEEERNAVYRDRIKKTRKDFEEETKTKKIPKQDGVFVPMDDEVIEAEKSVKTVVAPTEVIQNEVNKINTKEEQKPTQLEKPEVVRIIENFENNKDGIAELEKMRADKVEIKKNYEKALAESQEERIKERIMGKIENMDNEITDAEVKIMEEEIKKQNSVNLEYFNALRDKIEKNGEKIRKLASSNEETDLNNRDKLIDRQKINMQYLDEIFKMTKKDEAK